MWSELWFEMAQGVPSEIERIKATDIFTFWPIFDLWEKKLKRETELLKLKAKARI